MKKIFCIFSLLGLLLLFGCSDHIDLYSEREILSKVTIDDGRTRYLLNNINGTLFYTYNIWADKDFAKVGDTVKCENGVIKVIKKKER